MKNKPTNKLVTVFSIHFVHGQRHAVLVSSAEVCERQKHS